MAILMLGASNAVNFTDGLDGLLAGTSAIAFGAYTIIAMNNTQPEAAIFSAAMVGAVLVFSFSMRILPKYLWGIQARSESAADLLLLRF